MNKRQLDRLEEVFGYEIESALGSRITNLHPANDATSKKLIASGHLQLQRQNIGGHPPVVLTGCVLTELGRIEYCMSDRCKEETAT